MLRNAKYRSAFSLIELVAVASIMAILSLILVQQLRVRVEDSRKTAAMADLKTLANIISVSFAETRCYYPLQCYESVNPPTSWIIRDTAGNWLQHTDNTPTFLSKWAGPYIFFSNSLTMDQMYATFAPLISTAGPIFTSINTTTDRDLHYPLDPWGNPYIVSFLKGAVNNTEAFEIRAVYSLGPDGRPGAAATGANAADFRPWTKYNISGSGELGHEGYDDLKFEF
ncbi:MAG TPA: prepilin-type N-terminal cleavage/methylation domain-containing protein [Candidatus Sumerlaeota bacterium]|nr:prepilin-type N-terminal cleavage/methylation domain-containing protein [Candidatus Sumerlaeota bacterium]